MRKEIKIGDNCPTFELKNQRGELIKSTNLIGEKKLLVYFYPKDGTPGCTKQACSFRDEYEQFQSYNCEVIGISSDSPSSHEKFAQFHHLNFNVLADDKKEVRKLFGVPKFLRLLDGRVTYLFNEEGVLIWKFNGLFNATKHISEAIIFLEKTTVK